MKAYKGFNKDMTCQGFQYEEGKTYETDEAKLCDKGFHACENPLDCFGYYAPGESVYHEVEIEDNGERESEDTKVVGKKITIGAKLDVFGICKAHFEYVKEHCNPVEGRVGGDREAASAGYYGSASAGNYGSASAGESGSASAGNYGSASAGYYGSASAGESGVAVSKGSASVDSNGLAVVRGNGCKVKGGLGAVLVLAEENEHDNNIKTIRTVTVDGEKIKADTWYCLKNGRLTIYKSESEVENN